MSAVCIYECLCEEERERGGEERVKLSLPTDVFIIEIARETTKRVEMRMKQYEASFKSKDVLSPCE